MKQIFLNSGVYTYNAFKGKLDLEKYIISVLAKDTCCEKAILADSISTTTLSALTLTPRSLVVTKGDVTQLTSKTTAVESNAGAGTITTVALTDAADTEFSFTLTNSYITATSVVLASVDMNGGTGKGYVTINPGSGSAVITVTNIGIAVFNSAIKISFLVV